MNSFLKILVGLFALVFVFLGAAWWIKPEFAGNQLGMDLLSGVGLSTQIADLAAFFLTLGCCMLIGLLSRRSVWFFPAILLLGFAVLGRIVAWLFHGADLTLEMILVEVVVIFLLSLALRSNQRT